MEESSPAPVPSDEKPEEVAPVEEEPLCISKAEAARLGLTSAIPLPKVSPPPTAPPRAPRPPPPPEEEVRRAVKQASDGLVFLSFSWALPEASSRSRGLVSLFEFFVC